MRFKDFGGAGFKGLIDRPAGKFVARGSFELCAHGGFSKIKVKLVGQNFLADMGFKGK